VKKMQKSTFKLRRRQQIGMICNLQQNPSLRPIISNFCPALLRHGTMWLLREDAEEERWMLGKDSRGMLLQLRSAVLRFWSTSLTSPTSPQPSDQCPQ
jgi:hypothetical protein